jgi:hypothetical protein
MKTTDPKQILARYYLRNGVLRVPNPKRCRTKPQKRKYHKGYEIRLVAFDYQELVEIRRALRAAEFTHGQPFDKVGRRVVPVYGKEQVERLLALVAESQKRKSSRHRDPPCG